MTTIACTVPSPDYYQKWLDGEAHLDRLESYLKIRPHLIPRFLHVFQKTSLGAKRSREELQLRDRIRIMIQPKETPGILEAVASFAISFFQTISKPKYTIKLDKNFFQARDAAERMEAALVEALQELYTPVKDVKKIQLLEESKIYHLLHGTGLLESLICAREFKCVKILYRYLDQIPCELHSELFAKSSGKSLSAYNIMKHITCYDAESRKFVLKFIFEVDVGVQMQLFHPDDYPMVGALVYANSDQVKEELFIWYLNQLQRLYPERYQQVFVQLMDVKTENLPCFREILENNCREWKGVLETVGFVYQNVFPELNHIFKPLVIEGAKQEFFRSIDQGYFESALSKLNEIVKGLSVSELSHFLILNLDECKRYFSDYYSIETYIRCLKSYPEVMQRVIQNKEFVNFLIHHQLNFYAYLYLIKELMNHPDSSLVEKTLSILFHKDKETLGKFYQSVGKQGYQHLKECMPFIKEDISLRFRIEILLCLKYEAFINSKAIKNMQESSNEMPVASGSICIDELLEMFDQINFKDPKKPGYLNPNSLKLDGCAVTVEKLRGLLINYIHNVKYRIAFQGTPPSNKPDKLEKFYREIENALKNCIYELKICEDPDVVSSYVRDLAVVGAFCGGRFRTEPYAIYDLLQMRKNQNANNLDSLIEQIVASQKYFAFQATVKHFMAVFQVPANYEVHFYSSCMKILGEELGISDRGMSDFRDPYGFDRKVSAFRKQMSNFYRSHFKPDSMVFEAANTVVKNLEALTLEHYFRHWFCEFAPRGVSAGDPWVRYANAFYEENKQDLGELLGDLDEELEQNPKASGWFKKRLKKHESTGVRAKLLSFREMFHRGPTGFRDALQWLQGNRPDLIRSLIQEEDLKLYLNTLDAKAIAKLYNKMLLSPPRLKKILLFECEDIEHLRQLYIDPNYHKFYLLNADFQEDDIRHIDLLSKIRSQLQSDYIKHIPESKIKDPVFRKNLKSKLESVMLQEMANRFLHEKVLDENRKMRSEFAAIFFLERGILSV